MEWEVVWLICTVVLLFLYLFVIIALLLHRLVVPFNSTFFVLWINIGIIDILAVVSVWFWNRLKLMQWFPWLNDGYVSCLKLYANNYGNTEFKQDKSARSNARIWRWTSIHLMDDYGAIHWGYSSSAQ
jgi:hypothetical protein